MSPKLKKGIRWALSAAILVFLIFFARTINWHAAWNSMRHASLPLLAAAIGVNFLSVLIKGVRWWLFLRPIGITSLPLAIRATVAGAGPQQRPRGERRRCRARGVRVASERRFELHRARIDGARKAVRSDRLRDAAGLRRARLRASAPIRGVEAPRRDRARGDRSAARFLRLCDQAHQARARSRATGEAADVVRKSSSLTSRALARRPAAWLPARAFSPRWCCRSSRGDASCGRSISRHRRHTYRFRWPEAWRVSLESTSA